MQISSEKRNNLLGVLIRSLVVKSELNLGIVKSLVVKSELNLDVSLNESFS